MYNKYKHRKCMPHLAFYECLTTCLYKSHLNLVWYFPSSLIVHHTDQSTNYLRLLFVVICF